MSPPIHTPGPVRVFAPFGRPEIVTDRPTAHQTQCVVTQLGQPNAGTNARLLAAAYNAFDSAAKTLGVNAVELAEHMADDGISKLVEALDALEDCLGMLFESGRIHYQTDDAPIIAGRLEAARDILAIAKGEAA